MSISNNDDKILQRVRNWLEVVNVSHRTVISTNDRFIGSRSTDLKVHSVALARLFEAWCGTGSAYKRVPAEAFVGPRDFARGLLDGYISGDGTVSKDGRAVIVT